MFFCPGEEADSEIMWFQGTLWPRKV